MGVSKNEKFLLNFFFNFSKTFFMKGKNILENYRSQNIFLIPRTLEIILNLTKNFFFAESRKSLILEFFGINPLILRRVQNCPYFYSTSVLPRFRPYFALSQKKKCLRFSREQKISYNFRKKKD